MSGAATAHGDVGVVIIGRNEGARLAACLDSLPAGLARVVYVDSGSRDDSLRVATAAGATVIELEADRPFTAARGRNAGFAALDGPDRPVFVQFVDGDCRIVPGWLDAAAAFLAAHPGAAVVCGRRRERFPGASVYNRLIDREWDTPIGPAASCGGDAMMGAEAFAAVGGFDPGLIAGEEPELCARLRAAGWEIHRIDVEMTLHDADITRLSQWWRRARRGGFAAAQGAALHGGGTERRQMRSALVWGLGLPLAAVLGALLTPWTLALVLALPAQVVRLAWRDGAGRRETWEWAAFVTLAKTPEMLGVLEFLVRRRTGRNARLIEYK